MVQLWEKPPLCKGRWVCLGKLGGIVIKIKKVQQSLSLTALNSSLYTREPIFTLKKGFRVFAQKNAKEHVMFPKFLKNVKLLLLKNYISGIIFTRAKFIKIS